MRSGSNCNRVVELTIHAQDVIGSNHTGCCYFSSSFHMSISQHCVFKDVPQTGATLLIFHKKVQSAATCGTRSAQNNKRQRYQQKVVGFSSRSHQLLKNLQLLDCSVLVKSSQKWAKNLLHLVASLWVKEPMY